MFYGRLTWAIYKIIYMKNKSNHTFAILAYKESPFFEQCILSLQKQTVASEIFISTSTPSDFVYRLANKYHIPVIVNQNCNGIASDWSFAYKNCTTRFVTLAHQDDIYLPEYVEACLAASKDFKDNLITFTDYIDSINDVNKYITLPHFIKYLLLIPFLLKRSISSFFLRKAIISFGTPIQCATVMYHKEYIGSFEFAKDLQCNLDWEAWIRLSKQKGKFIFINQKLLCHRMHKESQTYSQIKNKGRKKEERMILNHLWPPPLAKLISEIYSIGSKLYNP